MVAFDPLTGRNHVQFYLVFELQRIKIIEIGNARQDRTGDHGAPPCAHLAAFQYHGILAWQTRGGPQPRDNT